MPNVDTILHNAIVLTMDQNFHIFEPGAVAIKDNLIVAVGSDAEVLSTHEATHKMDCMGRVLMPGWSIRTPTCR